MRKPIAAMSKEDPLIGATVVNVRGMEKDELDAEAWPQQRPLGSTAVVVVFSNGTRLYASRDPEGNGPGALFIRTGDGQQYTLLSQVVLPEAARRTAK